MNGSKQHGIERLDIPVREQPGEWPRITIGQDTWIGDRAVIMADVGKHCVIGAGAVVTKRIPDYAIAVGNPAKIVSFRTGLWPSVATNIGNEDSHLAPHVDSVT
jgi:tetrahydrodipicolinate N-succinyltransferase